MDKALWEQENDPANAQRDLAQPPIHPPGVFQMILRRERRRADRDGSTFALAVFVVSPTKLNGKTREIAGKDQRKNPVHRRDRMVGLGKARRASSSNRPGGGKDVFPPRAGSHP